VDYQSHFPTAAAAPNQGAAPFTFEVGPFVEARKQAWDCKALSGRTICALQPGQGQTEARPSARCPMLRIRTTEQRIASEGNSRSNHVSSMNESASTLEGKFLPGHPDSHILRRR
jgi:hypothetical protein